MGDEQVHGEAMGMVERGEALSLAKALLLAEKRVLKRCFEEFDAGVSICTFVLVQQDLLVPKYNY